MTVTDAEQLYALLPAYVRLRDETDGGGVLRALISVIAEQAQVVGDGLEQLYDDQFVSDVEDALSRAGLRPNALVLELR